MSICTVVLGHSGQGKSTSLRNLDEKDLFLVHVKPKPLPFKIGWSFASKDNPNGCRIVSADYHKIKRSIKYQVETSGKKIIVIDDAQYLMADEFMQRANETGFQKFTDIGLHFYNLISFCSELPDDVRVYFLTHLEENDQGSQKMKTIGRMLDEKITIEGLFTIILKTHKDDNYWFKVQSNGSDPVKTPMGMFEGDAIDNDLKIVDDAIVEYYPECKTKEKK